MSLWTPSGEHPVGDEGRTPGGRRPLVGSGPGSPGGAPGGDHPSGEGPPSGGGPGSGDDAADQAEVEGLRRQLAEAPAEVVVANHCYGLFELAAVYLSQAPPRLDRAQLAIDALGHLVEGLGDRLGEAHGPLRDALAQIRLAYVQLGTVAPERSGSPQAVDGQG